MMLFLWACTPSPASTDDTDIRRAQDTAVDTSAPADTGSPAVPLLPQPAAAADLDPDPGIVHISLEAAPLAYEVAGELIDGFAYNGQVPGPIIWAQLGDTVRVDFTNSLSTPTTVHWHGLSVPAAMDGVLWLSEPVPSGGRFTYDFTVNEVGTFWYHPHLDSDRQVDLGLYGVLVVEDPAEPAADHDLVVVWDTWGEPVEGDGHGHTAPDPALAVWTANGVVRPRLLIGEGETARVRRLNASNLGYLDLTWPDMRQLAGDQGLLPGALEPGHVLLAPGDRAEFEILPTEDFDVQTAMYTASGGPALGEPLPLLTVELPAPQPAPAGATWPFQGDAPSADPGATDALYVFAGGGGDTWLINGEVYPDVTVQSLALGQPAVIEVRNLSTTEHPFHLHGQSFEVLSVNGVPSSARQVEDTVNVEIRGTVRLLVRPTNPGDWMAHCHLLPHAEGGMMSVLRVE